MEKHKICFTVHTASATVFKTQLQNFPFSVLLSTKKYVPTMLILDALMPP